MFRLLKKALTFVKDVIVSTIKTVTTILTDIARNIFATSILVAATIGFTTMYASTTIFGLATISFFVPILIAPVLATFTVLGLLSAMKIQLAMEGISV